MFSIFLLKTQPGLWHLCLALSIHHSLWLDSVDIKVLDLVVVLELAELSSKI